MADVLKKLDEASTSILSGVAVAAISGCAGYFTGSFDLVASFASENPTACAVWSAAAFSAGVIAAVLIDSISKRARRKRREELLRDTFLAMSPRRKGLVRKAVETGIVEASAYDMDALALCEAGVLCMPPIASVAGMTPYSLRSDSARFIIEHKGELLG